MSHLIPADPGHEVPATTARLGFGVPGYAHPLVAPTEWAELTRPGAPLHWAVLNVARGPAARHGRTGAGPSRPAVRHPPLRRGDQ
jgi:hypothetical protein